MLTSRDPVSVAPGDAMALTQALVRVDSRNPSLVSGAPGEREAALLLAGVLERWGFDVRMTDVVHERPNVVARIGKGGRRSLLLNGHLDTVGVEGMMHDPFSGEISAGRLWGRGSSDMKGGIAAMCAAAWRASRSTAQCELTITAVIDEEYESLGTQALVAAGVRADAAIVTEPTRLAIAPAHRGFAWLEVVIHGRAAHGSRYDIGVDAIRNAGLLLAELDRIELVELPRRTHPLLGRASLHASTIEGGIGWSTYPDRCTVRVEHRLLPGETADFAREEMEGACARVRAARPGFHATVTSHTAQPPSDVSTNAPVVRALRAALGDSGEAPRVDGLSAWTDAALLNDAGVPAICFGPGDIALAHAAEEWIETDEIERATDVLARFIHRWSNDDEDEWRS